MFGSNPGALLDLKKRFLFLLGALVVYRIGSHIPVPGVNSAKLGELFTANQGGILAMFNMFSGGALERFTVFALGIMPYISSSIIVQLMTVIFPSLEHLQKDGGHGRRKLVQYTRRGTVALAIFQSLGIALAMQANGLVLYPGAQFIVTAIISLVCGTVFLMWLGEQISEKGIGNGISILIFAGIVSGLLGSLGRVLEMVHNGQMSVITSLIVLAFVAGITSFVVFVERGQRRIPIHYAKHQTKDRFFTAQQVSHLPLKVNMSGVMSPIFASSLILFPLTFLSWAAERSENSFLRNIVSAMSPGEPMHFLVYTVGIVFFSFFYTALIFNPRDTADNLKRSGAFVPGIRPGDQTAQYLDKVVARLTLSGSIYIVLICLLPQILNIKWAVPFYFGGTSLLIVVVVTMDFMAQVQSAVLSQHYDGLLKKTNFRTSNLLVR